MANIEIGEYYKGRLRGIIVLATSKAKDGETFSAKLIEDPNNSTGYTLGEETTHWNSCAFDNVNYKGIEEGKYYINLEGTIIVKATGQQYASTFSAVCIESTYVRFKPDYYSTGWVTDNFKEHDYIKSSNDLFPIF